MSNQFMTVAALTLSITGTGAAVADNPIPSSEEIVRALKPKDLVRGWSRGITVEGGQKPAGATSINLYVNFAYDSDALDTDATLILDSLGRALSDKQLDGYRFLIAGHTDARGRADYNLDLSRRRADRVRSYLLERFAISSDTVQTMGYGEQQLLDPVRPESELNRRVQVVNLTTTQEN